MAEVELTGFVAAERADGGIPAGAGAAPISAQIRDEINVNNWNVARGTRRDEATASAHAYHLTRIDNCRSRDGYSVFEYVNAL